MSTPDSNAQSHNPKALKVVLIVAICMLATLFLALVLHALYRRHRRAIWALWYRLRGMDPNAPENRYPAALPTRQSKRFKGIRVVDGNAILTRKDYDRLHAQTPILVHVDEIPSGEASVDFSQLEVMTVTTFSRAASIASPRFFNREEREGFDVVDDEDRVSPMDLNPVEVEMLQMKEDIARERNRADQRIPKFDEDAPPDVTGAVKPGLLRGMPKRVQSQHTLDPLTGVTIVTAMSREDLHAYLALEESKDTSQRALDKRAQIAQLLEVPHSPLLSPGVDRAYQSGGWDQSVSEAPDAKLDDPLGGSSASFAKAACAANPRLPTLALDYGDLSHNSSLGSSPHGSRLQSSSAGPRADSETTSPSGSVDLPALSVRSLRSVRFTLPERAKRTANGAGTAASPKKHRRREVRREVHRHHVSNGGYIICKDDDEEVRRKMGKKRSSHTGSTTPKRAGKNAKKRVVFQRRPSEEFYGTAEYLPAPSNGADPNESAGK